MPSSAERGTSTLWQRVLAEYEFLLSGECFGFMANRSTVSEDALARIDVPKKAICVAEPPTSHRRESSSILISHPLSHTSGPVAAEASALSISFAFELEIAIYAFH